VQYDSNLIQNELLTELTKILFPDIELVNIVSQRHGSNLWEIFFDTSNGDRIALSKMGSGIKTVLQILINLIVLPKYKNFSLDHCIFAFEELENNLHPAMQRRLFEYLRDFTITNDSTLFITTHSNIVIDIFGKDEISQIIHVKKQHGITVVNSAGSFVKNKLILKDLDVRASDILQSNGVIWVEGPSDRNYLNKWISLIDPNLKEGIHYSILPYGGRVLANFSFDYDYLERELIPLLKINTNAFVVIDKDGKKDTDRLNTTKSRIQSEIGSDNCWITAGREIENYLSKQSLEKWLSGKHEIKGVVTPDPKEKIEDFLKASISELSVKYNENKSAYSREITEFISLEDLDVLDLSQNINLMVNAIKEWNAK
jgi:predicted ATP-dependent endonuclease of OLD family